MATGTTLSTRTCRRRSATAVGAPSGPNNNWFEPYTSAITGVPLYFPHLNIGGAGFGGGGFYWDQRPKGEAFSAKVAHQRGSHYLKAGLEYRRSYGVSYVRARPISPSTTAVTAEHVQQSRHEAQRRSVCDLPAGRSRRRLTDDRRSGARSAHEVLGHVLPGRLETEPPDHPEPGSAKRIRDSMVRSGAQLFARVGPFPADPEMAANPPTDAGAGDRDLSEAILEIQWPVAVDRLEAIRGCGTRRSSLCSLAPALPFGWMTRRRSAPVMPVTRSLPNSI